MSHVGAITIPAGFNLGSVDQRLKGKADDPSFEPTLGVLSKFSGPFAGIGFNTIFRPNSDPKVPGDNLLELNLTTETLTFSAELGAVPNRGLNLNHQDDILLNGIPYVQAINDVTNINTGKPDLAPSAIHFEPGLWMHVPATKNDPVVPESLVRMASIPHGTTINAQGLAPTTTFNGPPHISPVDITPFTTGPTKNPIRFPSQTAADSTTPRLPKDLTKFIAEGTITQQILDDPNTVLREHIKGQNITKTVVFTVSTGPTAPELGVGTFGTKAIAPPVGGGIANIAFLVGTDGVNSVSASATDAVGAKPNGNAIRVAATFWIETVQYELHIPVFTPGQPALKISPKPVKPGFPVPTFLVEPPREIDVPKTIKVSSTQIQYSQVVQLVFATLSWPHVSVATLVPSGPQTVPDSAWN
jgi:hypothetical protein